MKRKLWLALAALVMTTATSAQNICLGERIPDMNISSSIGVPVEQITTDYVCLIFMHTGSAPCVDAVSSFVAAAGMYADLLSVVLLTNEQSDGSRDVLRPFVRDNVSVAFDRDGRTFENFGIRYVPFVVVYDTKRRKAQWCGTIRQLDKQRLNALIMQKPQ